MAIGLLFLSAFDDLDCCEKGVEPKFNSIGIQDGGWSFLGEDAQTVASSLSKHTAGLV